MAAVIHPQVDLLFESMERIRDMVNAAHARGVPEACSATLATASPDASPSIRTIYLSAVLDYGLVFFVNRNSGKGRQIAANPMVALCMFWPDLGQQVTVEGRVQTMHDEEANAIWYSRSQEVRLLDCALNQASLPRSSELRRPGPSVFEQTYRNNDIPRPLSWQGSILHPNRIDFWLPGEERQLYMRSQDDRWGVISPGQ